MNRGERYRLTIERPAAGGRMIARHEGAIVFVSGAIPGEVVEAEVEKVQRGTAWAGTRAVVERSPDRIDAPEGACGGSVFAHIAYDRQRTLKSQIIDDAFRRIGRLSLESPTVVVASPVDGYRMRARLHVRHGKIGFFREGSHNLCDAASTRQLRDDSIAILRTLEHALPGEHLVAEIELSENIDATARACHFELPPGAEGSRLRSLGEVAGVTGATCAVAGDPRTTDLWGSPYVSDTIAGALLSRHARSFFQGNRFLTGGLTEHVLAQLEAAPILDLYAGVGLFSVSAAAHGRGSVVAVEGDPSSAADLKRNAGGHDVRVREEPVEEYLDRVKDRPNTVIVDPPRTGMSKEAVAGVMRLKAPRLVYVSCDVATLARDARVLVDAGYRLLSIRAFDLFPNTAHVETVVSFAAGE
ncbi:MAG TPA: TRAM domain-containing protein [Vicinamibacterales bacterium]|nr:TRAM domain-containing protein [Vicinamibacterales bacterium]